MMKLSRQQKAAVEYDGTPTLVVAGAGSGKTLTLTAKIHHLISQGYDPGRILAVTFTNKAADEMKTRLELLTGIPSSRFPWVRTYHSACFKILIQRCQRLGYTPPLQIFGEYQQESLIKEILLGMNFDKKYVQAVRSHISYAKNSGDPGRYFDKKKRVSHIRLPDVYEAYEKSLKERNAVDFDNILLMTRNLLRDHADIRDYYKDLFRYILVDEYQDSNNLQEELTRLLLANGNLFCVGDDWQAIYGFRGSNVDHFLSFTRNFEGARVFRLEQNYRSADEIVRMANDLIEYNDRQMEKRCFSEKQGGMVSLHEFYDEDEEAQWVGKKIKKLHEMGISHEQMAVLYRTRFCSLSFEKSFRSQGIPYQMMGSRSFFERKEILDINCYLTAAAFPRDNAAFERIINIPKRGVGPKMLQTINGMRTGDMSLQAAARKAAAERIMKPKIHEALCGLIAGLDIIKEMRPGDAVQEVISRFNYMEYLEAYCKSDSMDFVARKENIEQLIHTAGQHETLVEYLQEESLTREEKDEDEEDKTAGVRLSTIHASKGLEYHVVFITGCEQNLFPHWKALETPLGLQEERRLMYVAVTRAEKYLFITSAGYRRGQRSPQSIFWREIKKSLKA